MKLKRTKSTIIGVTGSVGKTSTKEAVYEVLKTKWSVYRNPKSLNTEIGLLLAVLEQPSGFRSPVKWAKILARALRNAMFGKKYDFLVLEYGADKPGDIAHLTSIVRPHIGIITKIETVHRADGQFKNDEETFNEKKKLVECLDASGIAILNASDHWLQKLGKSLRAKTFWFNGQDISAENIKNTSTGFSAEIHASHKKMHSELGVLGTFHADVILAALLCGLLNGVTLEEGIVAMKNFRLPPGRMSLINGKNDSLLIDSTYNSSPKTLAQALDLLQNFPAKRRIAVIGDMNELGEDSVAAHKDIAKHTGSWLDMLITVGDLASVISSGALKQGLSQDRIKNLLRATEAAEFLSPILRKGDVVLLKGSQNKIHLERAVKMLMAQPEMAKKLLCRQEPEWEKIK